MRSTIKYIAAILLLLSPISLPAQTSYTDSLKKSQDSITKEIGRNKQEYTAFYLEYGGNGAAASLNFDLRYWSHYSFRLGAGAYFSSGGHSSDLIISPGLVLMASYLFFDSEFHVETGIGAFVVISKNYRDAILPDNNSRVKPTAVLGVRYQPYFGSMIFRAGYTPYFDVNNYIHFFGFGFGYCIE